MKEVKLTIPDKWSDITIETYQKYVEIQEGKGSEKNKTIKSLALLCDTTTFIVKKMAYKDLLEIMGIITNLIDTEPDKEEFRSYKWATDKNGDVLNTPVKINDHLIDATRYLCLNKLSVNHSGKYYIL